MFAGLRVLELASVLAGPSVGQFFAELGAEVIKVENPVTGGDVTRSWKSAGETTDDRSAYFCSCNWGKKSIALDLGRQADKATLAKLVSRSDVIIVSYKPGDADKLGISYEQLRILNPRLVYGQITGYGPSDERVGYDAVIQAESGFMSMNGDSQGPPVKMPVALIDQMAAHQLKEGLLVALFSRERTGEGALVEVSLLDAAITSLANQATNWLVNHQIPLRQGSTHPNIAPYGDSFFTDDHKNILLAVGNDRQFFELLTVLGLDHLSNDDRFRSNQQRVANRTALAEILGGEVKRFTSERLLNEFRKRKIPAGLIQDVREALASPEVKTLLVQSEALAGIRQRAFVLDGERAHENLLPPPHLGEHTREILALIG